MRVEKNKINLGTCVFPTPILDKPLFAAVDIYDVNASLTLVNELCWDINKKPIVCTLSDGNMTAVKTSGY